MTISPSIPLPRPLAAVAPATLSLSGEWRFAVDPQKAGEEQNWYAPGFDDASWLPVSVPHTWNVMPDFSDYEGLAWYRRRFTLPPEAREAHVRLRFEAVFYLARVWLNGEYLGAHEAGYTPFEFDVSGLTRPGGENVLAVQVDNARSQARIPAVLRPGWGFDWWNYGGLVREVALETTARAFIARQRVVAVPHLSQVAEADAATITGSVTVRNLSAELLTGTLTADVLDEAGGQSALRALPSAAIRLAPGESADVQLIARLASPKLWHFDHPNLYRWSASLLSAGGQVLHTDEVTIGIRLIELKEACLYLNGEPVRLVGLTRHQDSPQAGLAETTTIMAADYDDLKTLNEVLSRPVHYPQSGFVLDYADRHGILLIPEVPAWQLTQEQMNDDHMRDLEKQQLGEMIAADYNHPSVWAWSIGNEIESDTAAGQDFVRAMIAYVKSLDPTRPVGFASNRLGARPWFDATALSDFVLMNQYFGTWVGPRQGLGPALDAIHQTWPDKTIIISEFGFEPHWNVLWGPASASLDPAQYYVIPEDTASDSEAADAQRRQLIVEQMTVFRSKPFVAGAIFWTYQDYRTSTNFVMGVVDPERDRRGSWAVLREQFAPAMIESLTLPPPAGSRRTATVVLRTRGPLESDLPAYTLRGYRLQWAVAGPGGGAPLAEGVIALPVLAPGTRWSGELAWEAPGSDWTLSLSLVRPTGYTVLERRYNPKGEWLP